MRTVLLAIAVISLFAGVWIAWAYFQGSIDRDRFLAATYAATLVWFVCATWWAYSGPRSPPNQ